MISLVVFLLIAEHISSFIHHGSYSRIASGLFAKKKTPLQDINPAENEKKNALSGVINQIERNYGKGSIQKLGDTRTLDIATTSTGSLTLDVALGGGLPKGRVVEIYGPESSGKTTLALHAVAEVQKAGGYAAFIDAEHAVDPVYAKKLGVNTDELIISQPDSGEMALDIVDQLIGSSAVDIIVVDSVAALVPRAELEGDMGDMQMGLQARLMSKALRKITATLSKSQTTVIFINQLRSKIGVMFGNPEVTSGGNALKFYSSVRLDIRRKEIRKDERGILVKVKVVKNKIAPPFKVVEFDILWGEGIDKFGCLIDAAEHYKVIERSGSWYRKGDLQLAQGKRAASDFLRMNEALANEIEAEVRTQIGQKLISDGEGTLEGDLEDEFFSVPADFVDENPMG